MMVLFVEEWWCVFTVYFVVEEDGVGYWIFCQ